MYELYRNLNKQTKSVVPVIITDEDYDEEDDDDDGLVFKFPPVRKPLKSPCKYNHLYTYARVRARTHTLATQTSDLTFTSDV